MYNPGDVLRTNMTGAHVIIVKSFRDKEDIGYYKLSPLHDLSRVLIYNSNWVEDKLELVQKGK